MVYVRSVSDSNVWRLTTSAPGVPASTAPVQAITSTRDEFTPGLSPDGRRLAFWSNRSGEPQIWIAAIDGSHGRQLTSMTFRSVRGLAAMVARRPTDRVPRRSVRPPDVLLVPAEGGNPRIVTANLFSAAFPSFSREDGPCTSVDGTGRRHVSGKCRSPGAARSRHADPAIVPIESPDGRDLYYVTAADRPSALWRMPVAGGTPVKVLDGVLFGNFDVVHGGIYYLERVSGNPAENQPGGPASQASEIRLQYFDLSTRRSTTIAPSLGKAGQASPCRRTVAASSSHGSTRQSTS